MRTLWCCLSRVCPSVPLSVRCPYSVRRFGQAGLDKRARSHQRKTNPGPMQCRIARALSGFGFHLNILWWYRLSASRPVSASMRVCVYEYLCALLLKKTKQKKGRHKTTAQRTVCCHDDVCLIEWRIAIYASNRALCAFDYVCVCVCVC